MVRTPGRFANALMPTKTTAIWLTKNSAKFIGYSIASVLDVVDQAIVVDDGSTDRTLDVVMSLKSPKVQISVSNPDIYDMDWNIRWAISHRSGTAVFFLDDDYIWDRVNVNRIQSALLEAKRLNKWGVAFNCYNIIGPGRHLQLHPMKEVYDLVFDVPGNEVIVGGSFYTDNNQLIHKKESHGFHKGKHCLNKRYHNYLRCGIGFGHWKYVKDTKEEFIHKLGLFLQMSLEEAEDKWNAIQTSITLPYPYPIPEVFYEYRDLFTPLGGFDVVRWVEECQNDSKGGGYAYIQQ